MLEHHEQVTKAVMESQIALKRTRFDDDQAVALVGATVKLTNAALTPVLEQLNTHTEQLQFLKASVNGLNQTVGVLRTDVAELKVSQKETTQIVGDLRTDVAELKVSQKETTQIVGVLRTDVAGLNQTVGVLRTDVAELKGGQKHINQTLADLKTAQREMGVELRAEISKHCRQRTIASLIGFLGVIAAIIGIHWGFI